jgi:hypothetical protein
MKSVISLFLTFFILFSTHVPITHADSIIQNQNENKATMGNHEKRLEIISDINNVVNNSSQKKTIKGNVTIKLNKQTNKNVILEYELYSLSDGVHTKLVNKKTIFNGFVSAVQPVNINLQIDSLDIDQYQLIIKASSQQSAKTIWADKQIIYFTVTDTGIVKGFNSSNNIANKESPLKNLKTGTYYKIDSDNLKKIEQLKSQQASQAPLASTATSVTYGASALATTTTNISGISGTFDYYDRSNSLAPFKKALIYIEARDQFYNWKLVASTTTDSNGYFSTNFADNGDRPIKVVAYTMNSFATVADKDGYVYGWAAQFDIFGGGDVGTLVVPNDDYDRKAIWSFNDIIRTHDNLSQFKDPGSATIIWYKGSTDGTYYRYGEYVHLMDADPDSQDTAIHEIGHNYMYNFYGANFPEQDCPSPHYFERVTAVHCAWSEGWADFLPLYINNNPVYHWADGSQTDVETRDDSTYDSGDQVEGNVAASLWDLYDSADDGSDNKSYPFSYIYTNMWFNTASTFKDYWNNWVNKAYYDKDAIVCLNQNTIYY